MLHRNIFYQCVAYGLGKQQIDYENRWKYLDTMSFKTA